MDSELPPRVRAGRLRDVPARELTFLFTAVRGPVATPAEFLVPTAVELSATDPVGARPAGPPEDRPVAVELPAPVPTEESAA